MEERKTNLRKKTVKWEFTSTSLSSPSSWSFFLLAACPTFQGRGGSWCFINRRFLSTPMNIIILSCLAISLFIHFGDFLSNGICILLNDLVLFKFSAWLNGLRKL
jgi:hypothetical protein